VARPGPDAGYVTAELAVGLPALVMLTAMLLWGVLATVAELHCVDAAGVGARAAARGDADPAARARAAAPAGAAVQVMEGGETVQVRVEATYPGLGRLSSVLSARLSAVAVAAREDRIGKEVV
jgi:hypothetical protein